MTHEELLNRIAQAGLEPYGNVMPTHLVLALRAVVELHKPHTVWINFEGTPIQDCDHCGQLNSAEDVPYPCPTIQAIKKELM